MTIAVGLGPEFWSKGITARGAGDDSRSWRGTDTLSRDDTWLNPADRVENGSFVGISESPSRRTPRAANCVAACANGAACCAPSSSSRHAAVRWRDASASAAASSPSVDDSSSSEDSESMFVDRTGVLTPAKASSASSGMVFAAALSSASSWVTGGVSPAAMARRVRVATAGEAARWESGWAGRLLVLDFGMLMQREIGYSC